MSNPWDERYRVEEYYYGVEPGDFLREHADRIAAGGRVLCLAEGEGRNAVFLAERGWRVSAVDGSSVGLGKLMALAAERGVSVETCVSDLAEFDLGVSRWDAIISIWCHVPPALRGDLHRRVVEALKPGGVLILESYHPRQLQYKTGGPPDAALMMTRETLAVELQGLEFELLREIDREIQEGRGHQGLSAVVQCIARRKE